MTTTDTTVDPKSLLERIASWPLEDIEELAEYARFIEARRTGLYELTDEERAAIDEGLAQADRGEFVSDDDMAAFWKRCGVR
jgi:predicted transcriptional regulator